MCSEVFILDEYEKRILKFLALNGPLNLNQISKFTTRYANSLDRWAIQKRLHGTSRFFGLIPNEYIIEKNAKKQRYGKKEKIYQLTTKGIIASIAFVSIKKNIFLQRYAENQVRHIENPNLKEFVDEYLETHIKLLISWHYLNGIQLTKLKSSRGYFVSFFIGIKNIGLIDIIIKNKETEKEFRELLKKCIVFFSILDLAVGGRRFRERSPLSFVDWKQTKRVHEQTNFRYINRLWDWPYELEDIKFTERHQPQTTPLVMPYISLDEWYSKSLKKEISDKLNQLGCNPNWKEKAKDYYWD